MVSSQKYFKANFVQHLKLINKKFFFFESHFLNLIPSTTKLNYLFPGIGLNSFAPESYL